MRIVSLLCCMLLFRSLVAAEVGAQRGRPSPLQPGCAAGTAVLHSSGHSRILAPVSQSTVLHHTFFLPQPRVRSAQVYAPLGLEAEGAAARTQQLPQSV